MTRYYTVTELAFGRQRRTEKRIAAAFFVHRETDLARQVSSDGKPPGRGEQWLPKGAMIIHHDASKPFVVATVSTALLRKKRIGYLAGHLWEGREWTDDDMARFSEAQRLASIERSRQAEDPAYGGRKKLSSTRNEYA